MRNDIYYLTIEDIAASPSGAGLTRQAAFTHR
jgi:hypothetical protein